MRQNNCSSSPDDAGSHERQHLRHIGVGDLLAGAPAAMIVFHVWAMMQMVNETFRSGLIEAGAPAHE
ncbi:MAG TPA: hypothetical protein VNM72_04325 [Blastocatellia bacterium]|nr:hypothetical protein [Blastocatellia bacterium]